MDFLEKIAFVTQSAYDTFKADPTPSNLNKVVMELAPVANYALIKYGGRDDPLVKSRAKIEMANAVLSYDPSKGTSLNTHVSNYLQKLNREVRDMRSPIRVPEREYYEYNALQKAKADYELENDKEPTALELSDITGIPMKRIKKLNSAVWKVAPESALRDKGDSDETPSTASEMKGESPDYQYEAARYVYANAPLMDRKVMELATEFAGNKPMSPSEVARKLRVSPAQITRRMKSIADRVNRLQTSLEGINRG